MSFIKTPTKGMRDIMPDEMELRDYVINEICNTYSLYGFKKIETPCVEHIENISNNEGGENEKLIFKILKRGQKLNLEEAKTIDDLVDSGLRYDLTVPLSRYYANNINELDNPFKSLQIGNVWRADRPQKGRFRQFVQCDIDMFGEKTNLAEIELITATSSLLNKIGLTNYKIAINDRRILKAMALYAGFKEIDCDSVFISLDKMDKIGIEGVKEELLINGFDEKIVNKYLSLYENNNCQDINQFCSQISEEYLSPEVINNLKTIIDVSVGVNNVNLVFDPTLVRGMSYYTGPIFEIKVDGYSGSLGGGGRYDEMVAKYANISVPACGFSIGFERLIDILSDQNYKVPTNKEKYAFIIENDNNLDNQKKYLEKANNLRKQNKIVNIQYKAKNFKHQKEVLEKNGYIIYVNDKKIEN
jgi:histidyl-tRNA synthetase